MLATLVFGGDLATGNRVHSNALIGKEVRSKASGRNCKVHIRNYHFVLLTQPQKCASSLLPLSLLLASAASWLKLRYVLVSYSHQALTFHHMLTSSSAATASIVGRILTLVPSIHAT